MCVLCCCSFSSFACVFLCILFLPRFVVDFSPSLNLECFFSFYFQCEFLVFTSDPLSSCVLSLPFLVVHSFTLFWMLSTWCLPLSFAFFSIVSVVVVTLLLLLLYFFVRLHFLDSLIYRRLSTLKFLTCFTFFLSLVNRFCLFSSLSL